MRRFECLIRLSKVPSDQRLPEKPEKKLPHSLNAQYLKHTTIRPFKFFKSSMNIAFVSFLLLISYAIDNPTTIVIGFFGII